MTDRRTVFWRACNVSAASHPPRLERAGPSVWLRGLGIAAVLSLTAAACAEAETGADQVVSSGEAEPGESAPSEAGSDDEASTDSDDGPNGAADAQDDTEVSDTEVSDTEVSDTEAGDTEASDTEPATDEDATLAGPPRSVFPDVDVVEIASGQPLNVADELSGSGKATLLWFFAPH